MMNDLKIVTGSSNPELAQAICDHLGCQLTPTLATTFSDGELRVEIGTNVRGDDVFVIQPTCPPDVNRNLIQLCLMCDALKRASAGRITAVVPYYGYARQDRKVSPRSPISAKLVADCISVAGANRLVTIDIHAGQIQGFFNFPVDNLFATPVMLEPLHNAMEGEAVIVSPDAGGVERARSYAKRLNAPLAIVDKRRDKPNQAHAMHVIGDVKGKTAIIVDDMIDTAGTLAAQERRRQDHRLRHPCRALRTGHRPHQRNRRAERRLRDRHHPAGREAGALLQAACGGRRLPAREGHLQHPHRLFRERALRLASGPGSIPIR